MSLHHFSNSELPEFLRELNRVLKPGGYLFINEIDGAVRQTCTCEHDMLLEEK